MSASYIVTPKGDVVLVLTPLEVAGLAALAGQGAEGLMRSALESILRDPHGCPFCDSGELRNPAKDHDAGCGYALARAALKGAYVGGPPAVDALYRLRVAHGDLLARGALR